MTLIPESNDKVWDLLKKILTRLNNMTPGGTGNVTTAANIVDGAFVVGDGGGVGIRGSTFTETNLQTALDGKVDETIQIITNAGSGLQGGGDLTANRTLSLDIRNMVEKLTVTPSTDFFPIYDQGLDNYRKISISTATSGLQPLDPTLTALAGMFNTTGFVVQSDDSPETFLHRSIAGGANGGLGVVAGDGVAGDPQIVLFKGNIPAPVTPANDDVILGFDTSSGDAPCIFTKSDLVAGFQPADPVLDDLIQFIETDAPGVLTNIGGAVTGNGNLLNALYQTAEFTGENRIPVSLTDSGRECIESGASVDVDGNISVGGWNVSHQYDDQYNFISITNGTPSENSTIRTQMKRLTTTDGTVTNFPSYQLGGTGAYWFEMLVIANRTGGAGGTTGDQAGFLLQGLYRLVGGVATRVGAVNRPFIEKSNAALDATIQTSGDEVFVQFNGAASNNYTWTSWETQHIRGV